MGDTSIAWCDKVWNPVRGCALVSPGCTNCYAMKQAHRFSGPGGAYEGLTKMTSHGPVWTGRARAVPEMLDDPYHWRKPRRIFVNSMSDLFHDDVPDHFIASVFGVMETNQRHTFQILTKRPERMLAWVKAFKAKIDYMRDSDESYGYDDRFRNVWLGVSVEDQERADERTPLLLQTPATVRFLSLEPLLGPVDLTPFQPFRMKLSPLQAVRGILGGSVTWVIVGGESGNKARSFDIQWARDILAQCKAAGVPCFVKQIGARPYFADPGARINLPIRHKQHFADDETGQAWTQLRDRAGADPLEWPADLRGQEFPQ